MIMRAEGAWLCRCAMCGYVGVWVCVSTDVWGESGRFVFGAGAGYCSRIAHYVVQPFHGPMLHVYLTQSHFI
jgi:hypothetical protein